MSAQNANKLIEKLKNNEALKQRFRSAGAAGFEKLAAAEGCACTLEEFQDATKKAARSVALDDKAMEQVAGGAVVIVSIAVI